MSYKKLGTNWNRKWLDDSDGMFKELYDDTSKLSTDIEEAKNNPNLKDSSVTNPIIKNGAVTEDKVANDSISSVKIKNNSVTENKVADEAIGSSKLQKDSVTASKVVNSSIGAIKLKKDSVTPDKTSFLKLGKNKFDGAYTENYIFTGFTGSKTSVVEKPGAISAIIPVNPSMEYSIYLSKASSRFRIAIFPDNPLTGVEGHVVYVDDESYSTKITTWSTTRYIMIYLKHDVGTVYPKDLMVESGEKTSYSPTKYVLDLEDKSIKSKYIGSFARTGLLTGIPTSVSVSLTEETIQVLPNGCFVTVGNDTYDMKPGTYSYSKATTNSVVVIYNLNTNEIEFVGIRALPNDDSYAILGTIRRGISATLNGSHSVDWQEVLPFTTIEKKQLDKTTKNVDDLMSTASSNNRYNNITVSEKYVPNSKFLQPQNNVEMLYGIYNNLVKKYPDYVTRTLFTTDETGNSIFRYDFKVSDLLTLNGQSTDDVAVPKIVFTGTHAHEYQSQMSLANFITELCEKWQENELFETMRFNYHIVVIPILNPWGVINDTRVNSTGVDLNRNMPDGFKVTEKGTLYWSDTQPLTQKATQKLYSFMQTEKHIKFVIDVHNSEMNYSRDKVPFYYATYSDITTKIAENSTRMNRGFVEQKYNPNNEVLNYVVKKSTGGTVSRAFDANGHTAILMEVVWKVVDDMELGQKMNMEVLGNTVRNFINLS